jgi:hypothetical protein
MKRGGTASKSAKKTPAPREIIYVRDGETAFLNVDLDIVSARPLEPLVTAFGKKVFVLYVGGQGGHYQANLEVAAYIRTADSVIRRLAKLIEGLPKPARRMWDQARSKTFNIGIQSGFEPFSREFLISGAAVDAVARVGGSIVITVYAAEHTYTPPNKTRRQ